MYGWLLRDHLLEARVERRAASPRRARAARVTSAQTSITAQAVVEHQRARAACRERGSKSRERRGRPASRRAVEACMAASLQAQGASGAATPRGPAITSAPAPALDDRRGGDRPLELAAARSCAPSSPLTSTCPAWLTRTMRPRSSSALAVRPTPTPVGDALPGLRRRRRCGTTLPRRPKASDDAVVADHAEAAALCRAASSARKRCAVAIELEQQALLAGDVELAADARGSRRGAGSSGCRCGRTTAPRCAPPSRGAQDQVVGADDDSRCCASANQTSRNGLSAPCAA